MDSSSTIKGGRGLITINERTYIIVEVSMWVCVTPTHSVCVWVCVTPCVCGCVCGCDEMAGTVQSKLSPLRPNLQGLVCNLLSRLMEEASFPNVSLCWTFSSSEQLATDLNNLLEGVLSKNISPAFRRGLKIRQQVMLHINLCCVYTWVKKFCPAFL